MQLEFANQSKSINLINEACIFPNTDRSTKLFEIPHSLKPDAVILFPERFVGAAPVGEVRAVI